MPHHYQYTAQAMDSGQQLTSSCFADSADAVRLRLKRLGYRAGSVSQIKSQDILGPRKRVTLQDMVGLCRRFSVMYGAGLPLLECVELLAHESDSKQLADALEGVHDDIQRGCTVADAFAKYPRIFGPLFINMLRAGETAGEFDYVLNQLAIYMERDFDLRRKIRQAFAYPVVVVSMIFVVVSIIMVVVIPVFSKVYLSMGIQLPGPTLLLIFISEHIVSILSVLLGMGLGLVLLYRWFQGHPDRRVQLDRRKLSLFLVGSVYHKAVLLRFIRTLSIMVKAGIPLAEAISIADTVAGNAVASEAVGMIQHSISRGGTVTEAIKVHAFFPESITHAFAAGEEAGKLGEMLGQLAQGLETEMDDAIQKIVTKIEPLLVGTLSLVIGFILMAIYLPIFDLMKAIKR